MSNYFAALPPLVIIVKAKRDPAFPNCRNFCIKAMQNVRENDELLLNPVGPSSYETTGPADIENQRGTRTATEPPGDASAPRELSAVAAFFLEQQRKLERDPLGACALKVALVWILTGVLTLIPAVRKVIETLFKDQDYALVSVANVLMVMAFTWVINLVSKKLPLNWLVLLLYAVAQSVMLAALDVLGKTSFAFVYSGAWCFALLVEVLLVDRTWQDRQNQPPETAIGRGWTLHRMVSLFIAEESIACPFVVGALASAYAIGGYSDVYVALLGASFCVVVVTGVALHWLSAYRAFDPIYAIVFLALVHRFTGVVREQTRRMSAGSFSVAEC